MKIQDLVFVGIGGKVLALYRNSGEQAWVVKLGSDFVNVVVHDGKVYAASGGEIFCLDPFSGQQLWHNPLKGFGLGLVTMAFDGGLSGSSAVMAQKVRGDEAAAGATTAV